MGELAGLCSLHWVKMGKFGRPASISHGDNQWFQKNNAFGYLVPIITVSFFAWVIWTHFKMGIYQPNLLHHGSGRGVDIDTVWTNLTQSGVGQDSLPQNLDGLHIPKDTTKIKKNVSSISHCEMSFMWVPTGCGFLGGKSELFRTEVSKYHGSW